MKGMLRLLTAFAGLALLAGCGEKPVHRSIADKQLRTPIDVRDFGVATGNESTELWYALQASHDSSPDLVCAPSRIWARAICLRSPKECFRLHEDTDLTPEHAPTPK